MALTKAQRQLIIKTGEETSLELMKFPDDQQDLLLQGKNPHYQFYSEETREGSKGSTWLLPTQFIETHSALLQGGLHQEPWMPVCTKNSCPMRR
jgi:hypothetical protein